jgi:two-component system sensor histidine kinase HydH
MSSDIPQKIIRPAAEPVSATPEPARHDLERLDRLATLGLFSASMAHEIKNGLVAIKTFVEVLLEKGEDRELAGVVLRELKRIDGLATQVLQFATPKPVVLGPVNVPVLLDHSLRLLEPKLRSRLITLQRDYRAAPETVLGDEAQLQQVFINLLLNAVDAMGAGGTLTAATETAADKMKISIRDTGAGIAPENLAQVFDTFFTTKKNGTGLGLAISRRLVEAHHGTIEVQSKAGRGATFIITLPLA